MKNTEEKAVRVLHRWDPERKEYAPWPVPAEWRVTTLEADMDAPVECAQCGRTLPFGETFTSLEVHELGSGFGYAVCGACHAQERWRRIEHARVGSER